MDFKEIRYEVADRVLTITLNRPDKLNAFTERMCGEMIEAIDRADADDAVRAIIVTGAGRGFCADADRRGIVPEACSSWFLPRVVGISQALEWTYSGRVFPAEEALAGRLVSRIVPPEELLPTAHGLAREIADNTSAVSIALTRAMMWRMLGADHPMEAHRIDSRAVHWTGRNADAREGVTSFLQKRPPQFTLSPSSDMPDFYPWWEERDFK